MRKLFSSLIIVATLISVVPAGAAKTPPLVGYAAKGGGTILNVAIPKELLAIPLTNADGKTFTLGSLKGICAKLEMQSQNPNYRGVLNP